ncbi:hypothetical protein D3C80_1664770 [compost metagenome]
MLDLSQLCLELRLRLGGFTQWPAQQAAEPGVHIAKSGLPGLHPDGLRHYAAVHLATDAANGTIAHALTIGDQNVAGRRANHLHQRIRLRTGSDGPHVTVKRATGQHHAF